MALASQNNKISLVHVIWDLDTIGGAEKNLVLTVKGLNRSVYDQLVISIGAKGKLGQEIEDAGIPVTSLNAYPHKAINPLITFKLWSLLRSLKPTIVHSHLNYNTLVAGPLAGVPILVRHEHNVYSGRKFLQTVADRLTDTSVDKIIACCNAVKRATVNREGIDPDKIIVIRYTIDTKNMPINQAPEKVRKELGISPNDLVLITVASLTEKKGHEFLINAIPFVQEKYPSIKFVLVGDGPRRAILESMIKRMQLESSVIFTGTRNDIPDLLNIADLFILPSLYEGLPISLLEAQAMGIPCVTTDVGGVVEAIRANETGILVQPRSSSDLVEAILNLLSSPPKMLTMSQAAKQFAFTHFSLERYITELDNLYSQLMEVKVDHQKFRH